MEIDVQVIVLSVAVGTIVFSVGVFIGTARAHAKRLDVLFDIVREHGDKLEQIRIEVARLTSRRIDDEHTP